MDWQSFCSFAALFAMAAFVVFSISSCQKVAEQEITERQIAQSQARMQLYAMGCDTVDGYNRCTRWKQTN